MTWPKSHLVIGTKQAFGNKLDDSSILVRDKDKLVAKHYNQEERIDYNEMFALVVR